MTIRKRLALWYCGLLTLIITAFGIAVITVSRVTLLNTVDYVLSETSITIVAYISTAPSEGDTYQIEIAHPAEKFFHLPGMSVQIWRSFDEGQGIEPLLERASTDIMDMEQALDPAFVHSRETVLNSTTVNETPERVITRPFNDQNGRPVGVIQVAKPLTTISDANDQLLVITFISAVICIVVSIGLGFWLSQHLLKPIGAITATAASIAQAEDLSTRIQWQGPRDELGELAEVFNHTIERLQEVFKQQQRFIGDVSHELRTPLTSIVGHLEIMNRYGFDHDSLKAAHREAARMARMVNDLLLLTRADSGEIKVDIYPLDLEPIAREVYEQLLELTTDRRLDIKLERIEAVRMQGNSDRMRQLMLNLMDNAIKFTNDGGKIALSVYQEGKNAVIEVRDSGIGIAEKDQANIFERFFQVDTARVHQNELDGAGLGLSIVRWIVNIHGGTVTVKSTPGRGSDFRVLIPLKGRS